MGKEKLKSLFWDYNADYTPEEIYQFLVGEKEIIRLNRNQLLAKMLVSIRWYELVDIFGIHRLYDFLSDDVLKYIWKNSLKTRYKNVRETLQGIL